MQFLCLHKSRLRGGIAGSTWPFLRLSVSPFVCHQSREYSILKTNAPVLLKIGTSGVWGKEKKQLTSESKVKVSGITTAPADPVSQGAREGRGGPCANPPNFFSRHSCGLCIVVLMGAAQFTLNCSIAGKGPYDHVLQPLQGGVNL